MSAAPNSPEVIDAVGESFCEDDREEALWVLEEYQGNPDLGGSGGTRPAAVERVRLAIITLAQSDLGRAAELVDAANQDYRDVLAWAEEAESTERG